MIKDHRSEESFSRETQNNNQENLNLIEKLRQSPVVLIEAKARHTFEELKARFGDKKIIVADFWVADIEKTGQENAWGYAKNNVINIDHHALTARMTKHISSTVLAIDYVKKNGPVGQDSNTVIVINHTDCDSVLSTAILMGALNPEEKFAQAAIAADHTGEENPIGDLLQSLTDKRDLEFSLRNLELFLTNRPLETEAEKRYKKGKKIG